MQKAPTVVFCIIVDLYKKTPVWNSSVARLDCTDKKSLQALHKVYYKGLIHDKPETQKITDKKSLHTVYCRQNVSTNKKLI